MITINNHPCREIYSHYPWDSLELYGDRSDLFELLKREFLTVLQANSDGSDIVIHYEAPSEDRPNGRIAILKELVPSLRPLQGTSVEKFIPIPKEKK